MKIDKRLGSEFGVEVPASVPWWRRPWRVSDLILDVLAQALMFTVIAALLALGALVERFFPLSVYFFAGLSLISAAVLMVGFFIMMLANDIPDD